MTSQALFVNKMKRARGKNKPLKECEDLRIPGFEELRVLDAGSKMWNTRGVPWEKLGPHVLGLWLRATADQTPELREGVDLLRRLLSRRFRREREWQAIQILMRTFLDEPEERRDELLRPASGQ